jgi:WD40 repeat protein
VAATEDFNVKVYDLVLNSEIATLKGSKGRVSGMAFSEDYKILLVSARDGSIAIYNTWNEFECLDVTKVEKTSFEDEGEATCISYLPSGDKNNAYIVVGTSSGAL